MNAALAPRSTTERRLCIFRIIDAVLDGSSLREAAKAESVDLRTFGDWLQGDKEAAQRYARAQELRGDVLADEIIRIADTEDDAAKARNQITARQWLASKLNKKYGERLDVNVTQTLDISATLIEARARLVLPPRDQQTITDVQTLDSIGLIEARALDNQSIADDVPRDGVQPDIFS